MKNKKLYKSVSLGQLKKFLDRYKDDCTVDYFYIQVSSGGATSSIESERKGE